MNKCQCSERLWGAMPSAWSGSKKRGSTKTEPLSVDPVPGEPEGAAGVETRRSRKRSRATPHLPQVSLCSVRSGREGHSGVPMSHLLFLCLCWRLDWNSSRFPLVFVLSQCDSIMSHSKGVWGCAYPLSLFICQVQSVLLTVVSLCVPPDQSLSLVGCLTWGRALPTPLEEGKPGGLGGVACSHCAASESTVASGKVQLCLQVCAAHAGDHEAKAGVGDEAEQDTNDQAKCPSKFLLTSPSLAASSSSHTHCVSLRLLFHSSVEPNTATLGPATPGLGMPQTCSGLINVPVFFPLC